MIYVIFLLAAAAAWGQTTVNGSRTFLGGIDASATTKFVVRTGTAAPSSGDCDASNERGNLYVQTGDPASVATAVWTCTQTGTSTYAWARASHKSGTTAPATCTVGDVFFDSDATAGSNWLGCTASNTWTTMSGGAAGTADPGSNGIVARTGSGTAAARTITSPDASLTVTNGDGVSGNPQAVVNSAIYAKRDNLQSGATVRCASSTGSDDYKCSMTPTLAAYTDGMVVEFEATATANAGAATLEIDNLGGGAGVAIKKCDGSTNPDNSDIAVGRQIALRYDGIVFRLPCNPATVSGSSGVSDPGSNGIVSRTGSGTAAARSITAGSGISVTNGDGVAGNPTIVSTRYSQAVLNTTTAMTGSDVDVATFSSVPALPSGACFSLNFVGNHTTASWTAKLKVDGTTVYTIGSGISTNNSLSTLYRYCNTTAQSAQTVAVLWQGYSTGFGSQTNHMVGSQIQAATNNIDWSTSHTVTVTASAASGNFTVGIIELTN